MTLMSDTEVNNDLARRYGPNKGYLSPDQIDVELWAGDPRAEGVQMDLAGGYAPAVVDNDGTTWPDAPDGREILSAEVPWTPTGAWTAGGIPANVTHWLTRNHDTGDEMDCMPIGEQIIVEGPDDAFTLQLRVTGVPIIGAPA